MGSLEPEINAQTHEIGLVIDVVTKTQEYASNVCSVARSTLLHCGYNGRLSTGGDLFSFFYLSGILKSYLEYFLKCF